MRYVELKNCVIESTTLLCPGCQSNLLQKIRTSGAAIVQEDYKYFLICSNCNFLGSPDSLQVSIIYDRLNSLNFTFLDYSVSSVKGYDPLLVKFKLKQLGITTTEYTWDFGDGSIVTTTDLEIDHQYTLPGVYTVEVSCTNITDFSIVNCKKDNIIEVNNFIPPLANFKCSPKNGNNTLTVKFTDISTGSEINKWEWDFGDGETSREQHPTHIYKQPGKYTVTLKITNARNNSDIITQPDLINVLLTRPVAQFTVDRTSGYTPLTVKFTYSGAGKYFPDKYKWTFGDGSTSEEESPVHIYNTAGSYDVQLEVYNSMGADAIVKTNLILVQSPLVS